jgi:hypothetical protein
LTAWEDYRPEVDEYGELDDRRVLVLVQHRGRGRASGLNTEGMKTPGQMCSVPDGLLAHDFVMVNAETAVTD